MNLSHLVIEMSFFPLFLILASNDSPFFIVIQTDFILHEEHGMETDIPSYYIRHAVITCHIRVRSDFYRASKGVPG